MSRKPDNYVTIVKGVICFVVSRVGALADLLYSLYSLA
jgi:hypothetical protein